MFVCLYVFVCLVTYVCFVVFCCVVFVLGMRVVGGEATTWTGVCITSSGDGKEKFVCIYGRKWPNTV